jgi:hypothetical protein
MNLQIEEFWFQSTSNSNYYYPTSSTKTFYPNDLPKYQLIQADLQVLRIWNPRTFLFFNDSCNRTGLYSRTCIDNDPRTPVHRRRSKRWSGYVQSSHNSLNRTTICIVLVYRTGTSTLGEKRKLQKLYSSQLIFLCYGRVAIFSGRAASTHCENLKTIDYSHTMCHPFDLSTLWEFHVQRWCCRTTSLHHGISSK